jgi:hypothetical protein
MSADAQTAALSRDCARWDFMSEAERKQAARRAEFRRVIEANKARQEARILAAGSFVDGGILTNDARDRWVFILPDASEPGRWRYQRFDADGFSGHSTRDDAATCVREVVAEGFTIRDDDALDRLAPTPRFQRGNHWASLVMAVHLGQLHHTEIHSRMAEYDAQA